MIITRLKGGLGNQMFQYAMGRRIAYKNNTNLKLDTKLGPDSDQKRKYELYHFNINATLANRIEIENFKYVNKVVNWLTIKLKKTPKEYYEMPLILEKFSEFDENILKVGKNAYLNGFWQSEKYFKDIEDIIKDDFTVKQPPNDYSQELLNKIQASNSVVIHVRRGDYLLPAHIGHHGVCSPEYYQAAIKLIKQKVKDPHFFIFSDEPDWAKENIKTDAPTEVSYNPVELGYEDLRLMYSCKHFIIANSSLSWWGAWLSRNENKIVCAPQHWFANKDVNDKDVVPENWIKIEG